ncbi:MAG: toll/interleukin-1 receptor domain-containing protein [Dehalococcoidia bacterium]
MLAIDPDTLVASIVVQRPDGFVPDVQGHEDLFPLLMAIERQDGFIQGGDWLVASTPAKRESDGIYRSYRVEWDDPNPVIMDPGIPVPHTGALRVFLCHASQDKPRVRELYEQILRWGYRPWLDEEKILPGQDWKAEIRKAITGTYVVVVCLSRKATTKAGFVQAEIAHALDVADEQSDGTIFIVPLRLEDCRVPDRLQRWQWVDFFGEKGPDLFQYALRTRAATLDFDND